MTRRRTAIALLLIGTVALATRLGTAVAYRSSFPSGDELYYLYGAHSLARSGEIYYGKPVLGGTHWPPGQSVFLWSFVREDRPSQLSPLVLERYPGLGYLQDFDLIGARLVTALLSVLTVGLVIELGRRVFDLRTGLVAGFLVALYPNAVGVSHLFRAESNFLFAWTLAMCLCIGIPRGATPGARRRRAAVAGLGLGMAALFRAVALPMTLPFAVRAWIGERRPASRAAVVGCLLLGFAVALAPGIAHNWLRYDRFLLLDTAGGLAMYRGNNDFPPPTRDLPPDRPGEGGRPRCGLPNPVDNFRCEVRNGLRHVAQHPLQFAGRVVTRSIGIANPASPTVHSARRGMYGDDPALVRGVVWTAALGFGLLALAALFGLAGARFSPDRTALAMTIAVALAVPAATLAETRYRLPAVPAAALFAAHALVDWRGCWQRLRHPLRLAFGALGLAWLAAGWILYARHL